MRYQSSFALDADTDESLKRIARKLGSTDAAALQTAVRILEDIVVKHELELVEVSPPTVGANWGNTAFGGR